MKLVVLLLFVAILATLATGLMALFRRGGDPDALLRALKLRIALSVLVFLLLIAGWYFGLLQPHGLGG